MVHSLFFALIRREFRPMLRDSAVFWPIAYGVAALAVPVLFFCWYMPDDPVEARSGMVSLADTLHVLLLVAVWTIMPALAATAVQRDLEGGTFESLHATPLVPFQVLLSKAVVLLGWFALAGVAVFPVLAVTHSHFDLSARYLAESLVQAFASACCCIGIGMFVACAVRRPLLVPFVLYGMVVAVLLAPAGLLAVLGLHYRVELLLIDPGDSAAWALLHPWQGWPTAHAAYGYLAYLIGAGVLLLVAAQIASGATRYPGDVPAPTRKEVAPWRPIGDFANPVSAAYYRTNPFSSPGMQRVLFAVGCLGGLGFRVCLFPGWTYLLLGHIRSTWTTCCLPWLL